MKTEKDLIELSAALICSAKLDYNQTVDELTKLVSSIKSTRRSERRADGSNSKAKEVCPKTGFCNIAEQYGFCPYQCALFNREQTD